jgi:NADH dehydrogenase/NADH:ubiquinone oxidoreductase subunit G
MKLEEIETAILTAGVIGILSLLIRNLFTTNPRISENERKIVEIMGIIESMKLRSIEQFNRLELADKDTRQELIKTSSEIREEFQKEIIEVNVRFDRLEQKLDNGLNHLNLQISNLLTAVLAIKGDSHADKP